MNAKLFLLGTGAAVPGFRGLPCIALRVGRAIYLLDIGEGCQARLHQAGLGVVKIRGVFITHLHGDHYLGLFGLLQTMHMMGREDELAIVAPRGLEAILRSHLENAPGKPGYPIMLGEAGDGLVYRDQAVEVYGFPVDHGVDAYGYRVKWGKRTLVYTGDTRPCRRVVEESKNASMLIHEATFTSDMRDEALEQGHSTAGDAAMAAAEASPGLLVLTHISQRYRDSSRLFYDAYRFYKRVVVAEDYMVIML